MATRKVKTYCRFCHAYCPMVATAEDNRLVGIAPDPDNEIYGGYTCVKGRQLIEQIYHPERLQQPLKRQADGSFAAIGSQQAFDEIADKLKAILAAHGPRSIASYNGTYSFQNSASHAVARAWHQAIGSPSYYSSITIDQPAKVAIAPARMGWWDAGNHMWNDSDVALIIGNNTLVSHYSIPGGVPSFNPFNALREGRKRGMKVICIDPRRSELASRSDLHLQVKPGQDAVLLASIIQVILSEKLYDADFCTQHTEHLEELDQATRRFTPEIAAKAVDIPVEQIYQAARLFGSGPKGSAVTGTGPEMGPHPNLVQHLVLALNAICGRHYREGERVPNPGVLNPALPRRAQASPPRPQWLKQGAQSRIAEDVYETVVLSPYGPQGEMPAALICDEILTPGEGQIKALICVGGNPLLAFPDQEKTHRALAGLELLVCIDIKMAATAQMADYVLAPKICLEREDVTLLTDIWHDQPYSQYTRTVVEAEGDQIEEWEFFWEISRRMGLELSINDNPVDMLEKPAKFDLLEKVTHGSRVPLKAIYQNEGGTIYPVEELIALPPDPNTQGRLELFPYGLEDELAAAWTDCGGEPDPDFPYLLTSRRMRYTYNSTGPEMSLLGKKNRYNPAYIHPSDLASLGVADGELVNVSSRHGSIPAIVAASDDVKPGVVSMSHCWGGSPDPVDGTDDKVREIGSNTSRLINNRDRAEKFSAIPRQSAVAVQISKREL
ncbi:MAG: molybdopterin-containing oxidoreductase family protein [Pseudomonadales bacterium]